MEMPLLSATTVALARNSSQNAVLTRELLSQKPAIPALLSRVWTQFSQHLIAKMWSMDRKLRFSFSKRVVNLRISFIRQKKRSTKLRIA